MFRMDKLAWLRSFNVSLHLPCRRIKRDSKAQFWLDLFALLHLGTCCLLLREEGVDQTARIQYLLSQIKVSADLPLLHPAPPRGALESCDSPGLGEPLGLCNSLGKGWDFPDTLRCPQ